MRLRFTAAVGVITLAVAITIPASPAQADSFRDDQWYLKTLKISEAQAISKGSGVTVAVVDTGVYPHPDLKRNLLAGTSVLSGADGNPHADEVGHGTEMAALIAAHGRNSQNGVLGIAPAAKILPVKATSSENKGGAQEIANGVKWAASERATVINVSAGAAPAADLIDAVGAAIDDDIVVVAAAGNRQDPIIPYPAAIDGVLAVGSTDRNGRHASFSLTDDKVQLCAPGVDITTAEPKNKYVDVDGTSPSTAIVSGAAALVRAKFPELSAKDVINRLTATADDIGPPGRDNECGFGLLNIVKALTADVPPLEGGGTATSAATSAATASTPSTVAPTTGSGDDTSAEPASSSTPLILGVVAGLVVAGGLVAALVIRRRRSF